jgi:hypothetical protein
MVNYGFQRMWMKDWLSGGVSKAAFGYVLIATLQ